MIKDCEIIKELETEIDKPFPQLDPGQIDETLNPGYAVDESGYVVAVNFYRIENLKHIPEILLKFSHLKKLLFYQVGIRDFSMLEKLPNLVSLKILESPIDDISVLKGLINLKELVLNYNRLTDISALQGLSNLKKLYLGFNQITDISALKGLNNLTTLYLSSNQIRDILVLQELNNLEGLYLRNNQLTDISSLQGLKNLILLDLRHNKIKKVPKTIVDLDMEIDVDKKYRAGKGILLYGNPLGTPPPEIIRKGKDAIKVYFESLEKGKRPLNEVKILLVGDGGAGKTSLVKHLLGKRFNEKEPKTPGINIDDRTFQVGDQEIITHLWDFGGQEIMHATHQFFLSKRSMYILVLDGRKDEKIEYWLKHIESFGGESPVLVVINKIDENPAFDVNRKFLKEKYKDIQGFFRVSCKTKEGIDVFLEALKKAIRQIDILKTTWPVHWFNVKSHLEKMKDNFISYTAYREICTEKKITEKLSQDTLLHYLNDLGIILNFRTLELEDTHVLDPRWVTEAVYKIINSEKPATCNGVLKLNLLDEILKQKYPTDYFYPPDIYKYIIGLMKKFELCYALENERVLIPDLLELEEKPFDFDYATSLKFNIQYDFLLKSLMPRFIVRMHKDIKDDLQWRTGVVLEDKAFHATAVVKADERDRKISIFVNGEQKRDYFSIIRKTIRDINGPFEKLEPKELVPLPGNDKITVEYEELIGHELEGQSEIFIGKLRRKYSVSQLLEGIEKKEDRMKEQYPGKDTIIDFKPHIEFNPQIDINVETVSTQTQTSIQTIEIEMQTNLRDIQETFADLKDVILEKNPGLERALKEIGDSWDDVHPDDVNAKNKKEKLTSPMNKTARFLKKLGDKDSDFNKILAGSKKGIEYIQKLGRTYNKLAPWVAMPTIPDFFLGKKKDEKK